MSLKNDKLQKNTYNDYSVRMKVPSNLSNDCYGAIISDRADTRLPKIKSNNVISDTKQTNLTLDESNKAGVKLESDNSVSPFTQK